MEKIDTEGVNSKDDGGRYVGGKKGGRRGIERRKERQRVREGRKDFTSLAL